MLHVNVIVSDWCCMFQLCLALADLALQMSSWQKPVVDLIGKFGRTNVWPLLEILTVLPEEVNSRLLRLGANRRLEVMQEFGSTAPTVTEFLVSFILTKSSRLASAYCKFYFCWLSCDQKSDNINVCDDVLIY
jgi:Exportin 1-like protein.